MNFPACLPGALVLMAIGCSQSSEPASEQLGGTARSHVSGLSAPLGSPDAPGYTHSLDRSLFALGSSLQEEDVGQLHRIVGTNGVFAINKYTGSSLGVPNSDAPMMKKSPLSFNPATHDDRVRAYFVGAGVPSDQIKKVRPQTLMAGGSPVSKAMLPDEPARLVACYSVLERSIAGVDVPDSYAWARFDSDDEVVEEGLYWPVVSGSVVDKAQRLAALVADGASNKSLLQAAQQHTVIALDMSTITVAIHHAFGTVQSGPLELFASIDIRSSGQKSAVHSFDENGVEIARAIPWLSTTTRSLKK